MRWRQAWAVSLLALFACAPPKILSIRATRPIEEGRAVAVVAGALQSEGETPTDGRDVALPSGRLLHVDVGVASGTFGVAYLTDADRARLDPKVDLPPRASSSDFWITQATGADASTVLLLLDPTDYRYNDRPAEREASAILVERRLARDIHEFVAIVRARKAHP